MNYWLLSINMTFFMYLGYSILMYTVPAEQVWQMADPATAEPIFSAYFITIHFY